jgi:hypothetical protein
MKIPGASYVVAFLFLLLSCVSPVKSYHKALAAAPFDVIIVPGIPFQDQDWTSNLMKDRVVWSLYLYKKGIAAYVPNFVPLPQRENIIKRLMGTLGYGIRLADSE